MELLTSLGVNWTLYAQFAIFVVSFVVLKTVLFDPYFAAYLERNNRTVGKAEQAERFLSETRELEEKFAARARELNERYKAAYDKTRSEATKEYDRLVGAARDTSKKALDESRVRIQKEMESARGQLTQEVGGVAQLINRQLIGKDLNA